MTQKTKVQHVYTKEKKKNSQLYKKKRKRKEENEIRREEILSKPSRVLSTPELSLSH